MNDEHRPPTPEEIEDIKDKLKVIGATGAGLASAGLLSLVQRSGKAPIIQEQAVQLLQNAQSPVVIGTGLVGAGTAAGVVGANSLLPEEVIDKRAETYYISPEYQVIPNDQIGQRPSVLRGLMGSLGEIAQDGTDTLMARDKGEEKTLPALQRFKNQINEWTYPSQKQRGDIMSRSLNKQANAGKGVWDTVKGAAGRFGELLSGTKAAELKRGYNASRLDAEARLGPTWKSQIEQARLKGPGTTQAEKEMYDRYVEPENAWRAERRNKWLARGGTVTAPMLVTSADDSVRDQMEKEAKEEQLDRLTKVAEMNEAELYAPQLSDYVVRSGGLGAGVGTLYGLMSDPSKVSELPMDHAKMKAIRGGMYGAGGALAGAGIGAFRYGLAQEMYQQQMLERALEQEKIKNAIDIFKQSSEELLDRLEKTSSEVYDLEVVDSFENLMDRLEKTAKTTRERADENYQRFLERNPELIPEAKKAEQIRKANAVIKRFQDRNPEIKMETQKPPKNQVNKNTKETPEQIMRRRLEEYSTKGTVDGAVPGSANNKNIPDTPEEIAMRKRLEEYSTKGTVDGAVPGSAGTVKNNTGSNNTSQNKNTPATKPQNTTTFDKATKAYGAGAATGAATAAETAAKGAVQNAEKMNWGKWGKYGLVGAGGLLAGNLLSRGNDRAASFTDENIEKQARFGSMLGRGMKQTVLDSEKALEMANKSVADRAKNLSNLKQELATKKNVGAGAEQSMMARSQENIDPSKLKGMTPEEKRLMEERMKQKEKMFPAKQDEFASSGTKVNEKKSMKEASSSDLNDLYKEAAAHILNEEFPVITSYRDPIHNIKFNR